MDNLTRRTLDLWPTAPTTPLDALRHTLAIGKDIPDTDMAVMVTSGVYGPGVNTGLTWGDLRALAALLAPEGLPGRVARLEAAVAHLNATTGCRCPDQPLA